TLFGWLRRKLVIIGTLLVLCIPLRKRDAEGTWEYDGVVVFHTEVSQVLDVSTGQSRALHQHVPLLLGGLALQVDQHSGGLVHLTAVIDPAARQDHGHALLHPRGVAARVHCLSGAQRLRAVSAAAQQGEHGGLSAQRTSPSFDSSSPLLLLRPRAVSLRGSATACPRRGAAAAAAA
uniref:Uncharacterized protein n=1 Tax=Gasterosteus aculeatus TaxID=69293 RepID=G3NAL1_GASAC